MKTRASSKTRQGQGIADDDLRGPTRVEGQNPKADDAVDKDLYHDDNRRNLFDPEVARSLWTPGQKSQSGSHRAKPGSRHRQKQ